MISKLTGWGGPDSERTRPERNSRSKLPHAARKWVWPNLHGQMPALTGVRGLAVLMVLIFHFVGTVRPTNLVEHAVVSVTNYGSFGVELFFILSGFLITGILYDTRPHPHYFRNFYGRRSLRIFPIYYGVLALVFFVAPLIGAMRGPTLDYLIQRQGWAWLYAVNIYIARQGDWSFSYLDHFWSLSIEEHFYLFWPLVVFVLARRPRMLVVTSLAIVIGASLGRFIGSLLGLSWWTMYTLTPFRLDGLAFGAFLAVAARQPGGLERLVRALPWVFAAASALLASTYAWAHLAPEAGQVQILPVRAELILILLACLLVLALIAPERSITSRFFCCRPMAWLGTYSYGLYVYHHFISYYLTSNHIDQKLGERLGSHSAAVALQAALGIALSMAIAYLSYEYFERRFLRLKRFFEMTEQSEQALSAAAPAVARAGGL